jgi:hypothetical protein
VVGDLPFPCPAHNLAGRFNDVSKSASTANRLTRRYLTAIGIDRKTPSIGGIHGIVEGPDFTLLAKTRIFEAHGREDGISIVDFGELNILWPVPRHLKRLAG